MHPRILFTAAAAALVLSSSAFAQTKADGVLVDASGKTVYTFDKDAANSGKSACNGECATIWPPVLATGDAKAPYSVVTRDDGAKQLAYQGKPLYLFAKDQKAGDHNGDGVKGVWHVVKD